MRPVCPFCGGTLPGKPGQYVKCQHCAETIYWAHNRPFRTSNDAYEYATQVRMEEQERARREQAQKQQEEAVAKERQKRKQEQEQEREQRRLQRGEFWKAWVRHQTAYTHKMLSLAYQGARWTIRFAIAAICVLLCLLIIWIAYRIVKFTAVTHEISAVLQSNLDACSREDAEGLLETCSVNMPDREGFKARAIKLWEEKDVQYFLLEFRLYDLDGDKASAEFVQKTICNDRSCKDEEERAWRNGTRLLPDQEVVKYIAEFTKESGCWKCSTTVSGPETVP